MESAKTQLERLENARQALRRNGLGESVYTGPPFVCPSLTRPKSPLRRPILSQPMSPNSFPEIRSAKRVCKEITDKTNGLLTSPKSVTSNSSTSDVVVATSPSKSSFFLIG